MSDSPKVHSNWVECGPCHKLSGEALKKLLEENITIGIDLGTKPDVTVIHGLSPSRLREEEIRYAYEKVLKADHGFFANKVE